GTETVVVGLEVDLTIGERDLQAVQRGYEQTVRDIRDGVYGEAQTDADEARSAARQMTDSMLLMSTGQVDWDVTLLLVEEESGLYHEVTSSPVTVDLPQVRPPWLDLSVPEPPADLPSGTVVDYTTAEVRQ